MSSNFIIVRDPRTPKVRVLECDGPNPNSDPIINYYPRMNLPPLSFDEWKALPDHDRNPRYTLPSNQDFDSACRVARLVEDLVEPSRKKIEVLARLELLFPGCTGDLLRTQPNLQSA